MINLVRSEWIKLRSVRSTLLLLLAAAALMVFFAVLTTNHYNGETIRGCRQATAQDGVDPDQPGPCGPGTIGTIEHPVNHLGDITAGVTVAIFLFGTVGVQIIGQEYRFNTIRPTFTATPRRLRVLVAKLVVVTMSAAVVSAIMLAICAVIAAVALKNYEFDGMDQRVVWATILFSMGWTMYGMGLGAVLRQPIAAIVILLVQGIIAEPLLAVNIHSLAPWLPFQNGVQMTNRGQGDDMFRSVLGGGIYFFLFTFVLWGVGAYLVDRRDA